MVEEKDVHQGQLGGWLQFLRAESGLAKCGKAPPALVVDITAIQNFDL